MQDLIIDCDPGIDDALALWLAAGAARHLNLLAVTCVAGNRPVTTTSANACRLLDAAGCGHVPVFAGASRPLAYAQPRCNLVHGADGLGGVHIPSQKLVEDRHACDYLMQALQDAPPHTITIAAIGPLTNLALVEARRPGTLQRARSLQIMGGAVHCPGNITPAAEFNFYADPMAAQVVLESGAHITLFPLDVTSKAVMSPNWIASLPGIDRRCARLSHEMLVAYASLDPLLHDACPIAYLINPGLFSGAPCAIAVECRDGPDAGRVVLDGPVSSTVLVVTGVQRDPLMDLVSRHLSALP